MFDRLKKLFGSGGGANTHDSKTLSLEEYTRPTIQPAAKPPRLQPPAFPPLAAPDIPTTFSAFERELCEKVFAYAPEVWKHEREDREGNQGPYDYPTITGKYTAVNPTGVSVEISNTTFPRKDSSPRWFVTIDGLSMYGRISEDGCAKFIYGVIEARYTHLIVQQRDWKMENDPEYRRWSEESLKQLEKKREEEARQVRAPLDKL